jgi:hypothetical protein
MTSTRIALPPALPTELLSYILTQQSCPTTLLICQSRASFLSSLSKAITHTHGHHPETTDRDAESTPLHPLLIPTLHQIATSRDVKLVFMHTVTHLRAWLAAFDGAEGDGEKGGGVLVVYGVLGLHRDTSEWSAQGIGNSIASVVEAEVRGGRRVVLIEEKALDSLEDVEVDDRESGKERVVWEERVPMLNGSMRRAGLESEEGGWSGRTVEVGRIVGRWFKFARAEWADA